MLAITLSRRDFREYDQLVTLYTKEKGKIEVLAKGIKKITAKNAASLEPFSLLEVEIVPGKEIDHLTKTQVITWYKSLREDYSKIAAAGFALSIIHLLTEQGEKDEPLFNLLIEWLNFLNTTDTIAIEMLDSFMLKVCSALGLKPVLNYCVSCNGKEVKALDLNNGGMICGNCVAKKPKGSPLVVLTAKHSATLENLLNSGFKNFVDYQLHKVSYSLVRSLLHRHVEDWGKSLHF